ncbi:MAG: CotH kinase family protein [Planctomycetaceae bacterium]|nr:CotH kinase family protein [Planctomycetaceae bacterium]
MARSGVAFLPWMLAWIPAWILAWMLTHTAAALPQSARDPSDAFFRKGEIPAIRLELGEAAVEALRKDPRAYAPCTLHVDGAVVSAAAGVKLKGAAGSFQEFDALPAFTVNIDRFGEAKPWMGLEKFHLNNSVQDPSLLSEWTCAEILREAGYAHTRVTHARVVVNGRDLGLYVLKESFDEHFLARNFKDAGGNLYDGGFCQDIDAELELDEGTKPADRADLRALADACRDPDMKRRWAAIERLVDIPEFVRFMALEAMLGHWDGYSYNSNNYRLYFDPSRKARFLLHGMDQCFGDPGASVLDMPRGMLASSVMKNPEWRKEYRRQVTRLLGDLSAKRLMPRLEQVEARVQRALRAANPAAAAEQAQRAKEFVDRLVAREQSLREQSKAPEPKPLEFKPGRERVIAGWHPMSEVEDALVETVDAAGARWLRVKCGPQGRCIAGFRRGVLLPRGRYRLEALVRTEAVGALAEEGQPCAGAGLRVSGRECVDAMVETGERTLAFEFEVAEETADVELVLELRASRGEAVFRAESIKLAMLPPTREKR